MPLDFCHPTAPHKKLKLPEWYVSSLMMDRALDAICRRVKKFDRKHDIPYLAGYSQDGKTIYIDRHMPQSFKFRGRTIDTDRFLILHEEVEKTLIDQLGLHYLHAHQIATRAEEAAVRAAGIEWRDLRPFHAEIRQAHRRRAADQGAERSRYSSRIATSTTTTCCGGCWRASTSGKCPKGFRRPQLSRRRPNHPPICSPARYAGQPSRRGHQAHDDRQSQGDCEAQSEMTAGRRHGSS